MFLNLRSHQPQWPVRRGAPGMGYLQATATGEMFTRVKRRKATLQSYTYLLGGQSHSVQGELLWGNPADSIALASEKLCEGLRC